LLLPPPLPSLPLPPLLPPPLKPPPPLLLLQPAWLWVLMRAYNPCTEPPSEDPSINHIRVACTNAAVHLSSTTLPNT
jgi:hypothetical protein